MAKLFVYRKKSGPMPKQIGMFLSMVKRWDGGYSHGHLVSDVSDATVFRKGEYPKSQLAGRGVHYEIVEVTVSVVPNGTVQG